MSEEQWDVGAVGAAGRPDGARVYTAADIGAMRAQAGILPAYHMSKEHWLSIELEQADDALIRQLIDDSFRLTQGKAKIRKQAT